MVEATKRIVNSDLYASHFIVQFYRRYADLFYKQMKVLDLGAGRYRHARFFRGLGFRDITCVDYFKFPDLLFKGLKFIRHDLEEGLPMFSANSFDLIVCTYVLEYIRHREPFMAEVDRIAREGCLLIVQSIKKPTKLGYPLLLEEVVEFLLRSDKWKVLYKRSMSGRPGYVLQKGGCSPDEAIKQAWIVSDSKPSVLAKKIG